MQDFRSFGRFCFKQPRTAKLSGICLLQNRVASDRQARCSSGVPENGDGIGGGPACAMTLPDRVQNMTKVRAKRIIQDLLISPTPRQAISRGPVPKAPKLRGHVEAPRKVSHNQREA
jgi:hypothetical protein